MKPTHLLKQAVIAASCAMTLLVQSARAGIAYGSINNFDTVNDTGQECHGFEIEIDDCHSTDITYTYDYNHYGTSNLTEDNSIPAHPRTIIRWESKKNPVDGSWLAYTAIPGGPINPTDGHQFTNPAVNFGGEHFGVGYNVAVGAVRYHWLIDNGSGTLVSGGPVQVSTPVYTYYQAIAGVPAQVQAVIAPPPPPAPEPREFGNPVWVKEIRTSSHNNHEVKLRDLISEDPDKPNDKNWRNGEPDEVETEWRILQKDNGQPDGGVNNEVPAAAEDLPGGDEIVTRRYEFYKYVGPLDNETGEAMGDAVGPDGLHGAGTKTINGVEVDLSTVELVGEYTGSQMAAVDVDAPVGLIDHVGEAEVGREFAARTLVVGGTYIFSCVEEGALPDGMTFNEYTGVLSGTPNVSGEFNFKVTASDTINPDVAKNYTLRVAAAGAVLPAASLVDTTVSPVGSGTTTGDGAFAPGSDVTVTAAAQPGFRFVNWTDNGTVVSTATSHAFTIDVSHSLVANFTVDVPQWEITTSAVPVAGGITSGGGLLDEGSSATVVATPKAGYAFTNWTEGGVLVSTGATYTFTVAAARSVIANFSVVPTYTVSASAIPLAGGTTTGSGSYSSGSNATVTAVANAGYVFSKWTVSGNQVSTSPAYTFSVISNKTLVANFIAAGVGKTIATGASPLAGGATSGGGNYATGDSATVVATPNPGYTFARWQEGGSNVSNSPGYTFTVTANRTLTAIFNEAFVITAGTSPAVGGTTEMDSTSYKTNENAKAKAFPAAGYAFANWTENGVIVSTDATYSFNVTRNRGIVANFIANNGVTVNAGCEPSSGGSVSGDDVYQTGDDVVVSATPNDGYAFVNWTRNGVVVSADPVFAFTANASVALVAHFAPPVAIVASASPPQGGIVDGSAGYASGATAFLTATANPGYAFNGWTEGSAAVDAAADYSFTVVAARTLVANFVALPPMAVVQGASGSDTMTISWPAANTGWLLEESTDLSTWAPSAHGVATGGGQNTVTVPAAGPGRYFRLAHP